ncbi:MAG: hypothetical protein SGJ20_04040, partial [Planctomycetota bacterium]|nr:hypothetical protein [Planctomycetota bacterium]
MHVFRPYRTIVALISVVAIAGYFSILSAQVPAPPKPAGIFNEPEQGPVLPTTPSSQPAAGDAAPALSDDMEFETRGPVHEAFAVPVTPNAQATVVIKNKPPEPVEELPPEDKPVGDNVIWIPGYFAWDDERSDFIWISGLWRDVPPGQTWVSGYWTNAENGWQWVSGFWTAADQPEVEYLPEPPASLEQGPSVAQPSEDHFWVPGVWRWQTNRYAWSTGYWSRAQTDWVWVPAHYNWCPNGYVYVNGYWDYLFAYRGVLFAPTYFRPAYYQRRTFFTPSIVISTNILQMHLFSRPSYGHYYFGDWYADRYIGFGIQPWYSVGLVGRYHYDPIFSYYRWQNRGGDWYGDMRGRYDYYRRNPDFRPPHSYRNQQQFVQQHGRNNVNIQNSVIAAPLTQVVNVTNNNININNTNIDRRGGGGRGGNVGTPFRFDRVSQQQREQSARQADQLRSVVNTRRELETPQNLARLDRGARAADGQPRGSTGADRGNRAARSLNVSELARVTNPGDAGATRGPGGRGQGGRGPGGQAGVQPGGSDVGQPGRGPGRDATKGGAGRGDAIVGPSLGNPAGETDVGNATGRGAGRGRDGSSVGRTLPGTETPDNLTDGGRDGNVTNGNATGGRGTSGRSTVGRDTTGREPVVGPTVDGSNPANTAIRGRDIRDGVDSGTGRGVGSGSGFNRSGGGSSRPGIGGTDGNPTIPSLGNPSTRNPSLPNTRTPRTLPGVDQADSGFPGRGTPNTSVPGGSTFRERGSSGITQPPRSNTTRVGPSIDSGAPGAGISGRTGSGGFSGGNLTAPRGSDGSNRVPRTNPGVSSPNISTPPGSAPAGRVPRSSFNPGGSNPGGSTQRSVVPRTSGSPSGAGIPGSLGSRSSAPRTTPPATFAPRSLPSGGNPAISSPPSRGAVGGGGAPSVRAPSV